MNDSQMLSCYYGDDELIRELEMRGYDIVDKRLQNHSIKRICPKLYKIIVVNCDISNKPDICKYLNQSGYEFANYLLSNIPGGFLRAIERNLVDDYIGVD